MSTLNDIKKNEGKPSHVSGKFLPADAMKRTPFRIELEDSTIVFIGAFNPSSNIDYMKLNKFINQNVVINGIVYLNSIPQQYKILSRLNGPYMVDITEIKLEKE